MQKSCGLLLATITECYRVFREFFFNGIHVGNMRELCGIVTFKRSSVKIDPKMAMKGDVTLRSDSIKA